MAPQLKQPTRVLRPQVAVRVQTPPTRVAPQWPVAQRKRAAVTKPSHTPWLHTTRNTIQPAFIVTIGPEEGEDDLEELGETVRQRVFEHSGVLLEWEIKRIGRFADGREVAVAELGGHPVTFRADEVGTGSREPLADIARVNPGTFLILTGGEPLLRPDIFDLAAEGREHGFTVVLGTNGVLLREKQARLMKAHGVQGASLSLDSTDPARHDAFRHLPGAWKGAMRATEALRAESIDFSLHMSVTDWNVGEIPAMIDLARDLGARVLNFFFLVRTGRGRDLTDIDAAAYERILTDLARAQGVGQGPPGFVQRLLGRAPAPPAFEDPWSTPVARTDDLLIRAKCAPHFRRILYQLNPASPLLRNYAHGSCPAGKYYCRITPEGDVTPCPYMPVAAGNLRRRSFRYRTNSSTTSRRPRPVPRRLLRPSRSAPATDGTGCRERSASPSVRCVR